MRVPLESIQYLVDVFIEGGYAEDEDLDHLDAIHMWLREEEQYQRRVFEKRITRDLNPDCQTLIIKDVNGNSYTFTP